MTQKDKEYYAARLRVELAAASAAQDLTVRSVHEQLANLYADLLAGEVATAKVAAASGATPS
jgi:hypothetical protein